MWTRQKALPMPKTDRIKSEGWWWDSLGKGYIHAGRDNAGTGYVTKYNVTFKPSAGQVQEMVQFAEDIIKRSDVPPLLIEINTSKTALSEDTFLSIKNREIYNEYLAEKLFKGIYAIGEAIEQKYFPKDAELRAGT